MKYSIVIAHRNEADNLKRTIANINETQRLKPEIIVVEDKAGDGPGLCRHRGIMQASNDAVIITDAHMRFRPEALDRQAEYTKSNPKNVSCLRCFHNNSMSFTGTPKTGAYFEWKHDSGTQHNTLNARWLNDTRPGVIPCIMGACYGISRDNYINSLGAPLRLLKGWGCDEEILSISTWLCGGESVLLDDYCAHMARNQEEIPYKLTDKNLFGVWYNRFLLMELLQIPEYDRLELTEWLENNGDVRKNLTKIYMELAFEAPEIAYNSRIYTNQTRNFIEWKSKFITTGDSMRKQKHERAVVEITTEKKKPESNIMVIDNGIPCPHCRYAFDHRITNTYNAGKNKRRICANCNRPFMTFRNAV